MAANGLSTRKQQSNCNWGIALAKRKKFAARQLTDCAGQKKNCGVAIRVLRRPKEKLRHGNQWIAPAKREKKLQHSNWGIAPASSKNSGAAITVSRLPLQNLREAWSIMPNGWRKAQSIAPNGWRKA
jgi:hypothetical protein